MLHDNNSMVLTINTVRGLKLQLIISKLEYNHYSLVGFIPNGYLINVMGDGLDIGERIGHYLSLYEKSYTSTKITWSGAFINEPIKVELSRLLKTANNLHYHDWNIDFCDRDIKESYKTMGEIFADIDSNFPELLDN